MCLFMISSENIKSILLNYMEGDICHYVATFIFFPPSKNSKLDLMGGDLCKKVERHMSLQTRVEILQVDPGLRRLRTWIFIKQFRNILKPIFIVKTYYKHKKMIDWLTFVLAWIFFCFFFSKKIKQNKTKDKHWLDLTPLIFLLCPFLQDL